MTLDIEKERRDFSSAKRMGDPFCRRLNDYEICAVFSSELNGWLAAKRASVGAETVAVNPRLQTIINFLLGEGPLDGKWFSDEAKGPAFWWRTELRELTADSIKGGV